MESSASILVVDDEENVRECIKMLLEMAGYQVFAARNGIDALTVLESQRIDLVLADIAMPKMNGYQLYQRVIDNPQWVTIPFIFLTARVLDSDIRYGKELGVDDYLTKPPEIENVLAAVRGRLRRVRQLARAYRRPLSSPTEGLDVLVLGALRIDFDQHRVWLNERQIKLSTREFLFLECLARQRQKVIPLQELVRATHGLDTDYAEAGSLLRSLVRSLRRKLGYPAGKMGCIENIRGVGYQLIPPSAES